MKNILSTVLVFHILLIAMSGFPQKGITSGNPGPLKFDFGAKTHPGYVKVDPASKYDDETGYGFEAGASVTSLSRADRNPLQDGFVTSNTPFLFSVKLPEGNYHVKVTTGDMQGTSDMIIRAECRRMMIERVKTKPNEIKTIEFTLHIRDSLIRATNSKVRIKDRERSFRHWDNKLTLEFNGIEPKVNSIEIIPAHNDVITVFLAGNSTVVDQDKEPYAAWGQMIPAFFQPGNVAIANYAESGESLSSFIAASRFEKVLTLMKPRSW